MPEQPQPPPLDYFGPTPRKAALVYDAECRRWQAIRRLYRVGLSVLIGAIAIPVFTNLIKFGKPTPLSAADFLPIIQTECVPVVRAIKQYQQDTGNLPDDINKLVPQYLASIPKMADMRYTTFIDWVSPHSLTHCVIYDFDPATEGWTVKGPFVNGPIPLPKVTLSLRAGGTASRK
jgi:hypothetical protein